ncbi:hypothetical protein ATY41_08055 [Leifsonia xyli subsp. xyli]|uniref:SMP-30/Gluconolactonase/LRE-like region domain-containing protein n=1 Tax=Leifsonia xyli subsp. xyli TaxID=59736 RepID=A0A1E2SMB3_LEIXY|nr:hypothetical protein ATY41_08055 [Leifsonia xyli subsp. xyli]
MQISLRFIVAFFIAIALTFSVSSAANAEPLPEGVVFSVENSHIMRVDPGAEPVSLTSNLWQEVSQLAFAPNRGTVVAATWGKAGKGRIIEVAADGSDRGKYRTLLSNRESPRALTVDDAGNIYFVDSSQRGGGAWSLFRLSDAGDLTVVVPSIGKVTSLARDHDGGILATRSTTGEVVRIDSTGNVTVLRADLPRPTSLAADPARGRIVILDDGTKNPKPGDPKPAVYTMSLDGKDLTPTTISYRGGAGSVAVNSESDVYVADGNRITRWKLDGSSETIQTGRYIYNVAVPF